MLSHEINELLTRVAPGTPAGELLRRYWNPVCVASEITVERPLKKLRVLGEDLVLFRNGQGQMALMAEQCPHRGASLFYGYPEDDGLRCCYHGWKYDMSGQCVEQPFEPKDSRFKDEISIASYPVRQKAGLLFAYMGPEPVPELPEWDLMVRRDGRREITVLPDHHCNWLQAMENSVDPVHTYYLHAHRLALLGSGELGSYYYRPVKKLDFHLVHEDTWSGIRKIRIFDDDSGETEVGHPAIFPNILFVPQGKRLVIHWRVPMDDEWTRIFWLQFIPSDNGEELEPEEVPPAEYLPDNLKADGEYDLSTFPAQDKMAWETQGPVADRSAESLGTSDRGIVMFRKLLRDQIEVVRSGGDPVGVIRDPEKSRAISIDVSTGQAAADEDDKVVRAI